MVNSTIEHPTDLAIESHQALKFMFSIFGGDLNPRHRQIADHLSKCQRCKEKLRELAERDAEEFGISEISEEVKAEADILAASRGDRLV